MINIDLLNSEDIDDISRLSLINKYLLLNKGVIKYYSNNYILEIPNQGYLFNKTITQSPPINYHLFKKIDNKIIDNKATKSFESHLQSLGLGLNFKITKKKKFDKNLFYQLLIDFNCPVDISKKLTNEIINNNEVNTTVRYELFYVLDNLINQFSKSGITITRIPPKINKTPTPIKKLNKDELIIASKMLQSKFNPKIGF